jgi:hypothetical protein
VRPEHSKERHNHVPPVLEQLGERDVRVQLGKDTTGFGVGERTHGGFLSLQCGPLVQLHGALSAVYLESSHRGQSRIAAVPTSLVIEQASTTAFLVPFKLGDRDPVPAFPVAKAESRLPGVGLVSGSFPSSGNGALPLQPTVLMRNEHCPRSGAMLSLLEDITVNSALRDHRDSVFQRVSVKFGHFHYSANVSSRLPQAAHQIF